MADWVRPARRNSRMRRSCPMVAKSMRAATASSGSSSQKKTVRVIFQGRRGCDRKKPRLWGSVAPSGRGQRVNPKNRVNFSIVTTCGVVRQFDPLRIVWHVAGRPGCGLEPRQRSRHCAPYIRSTARQKSGRTGTGSRLCRILRMIPIPTSAWARENDSHSQVVHQYYRQVKIEKISTFFRV